MTHYFKIVGPVEVGPEQSTVKIELDMIASDWLCKAMGLLAVKAHKYPDEETPIDKIEHLQAEVIKAWEIFRP